MMDLVASPLRNLELPVHVEDISIAQFAASIVAPHTKSCKFDPNVKKSFQIVALEDNGRNWIVDDTIYHKFDWIGLDMGGMKHAKHWI